VKAKSIPTLSVGSVNDLTRFFTLATALGPVRFGASLYGAFSSIEGMEGMSKQPTRQPVDLQAVTKDIKDRLRHIMGQLEDITEQTEPILADPKSAFLEIVLAGEELRAAQIIVRRAWWPGVALIVSNQSELN
jgi:hypothetical protein